MKNEWVEFVKQSAKDLGTSYGCALSNPLVKLQYQNRKKIIERRRVSNEGKERFSMSGEDILSKRENKQHKLQAIYKYHEMNETYKSKLKTSKNRLSMINEDLLSKRIV